MPSQRQRKNQKSRRRKTKGRKHYKVRHTMGRRTRKQIGGVREIVIKNRSQIECFLKKLNEFTPPSTNISRKPDLSNYIVGENCDMFFINYDTITLTEPYFINFTHSSKTSIDMWHTTNIISEYWLHFFSENWDIWKTWVNTEEPCWTPRPDHEVTKAAFKDKWNAQIASHRADVDKQISDARAEITTTKMLAALAEEEAKKQQEAKIMVDNAARLAKRDALDEQLSKINKTIITLEKSVGKSSPEYNIAIEKRKQIQAQYQKKIPMKYQFNEKFNKPGSNPFGKGY